MPTTINKMNAKKKLMYSIDHSYALDNTHHKAIDSAKHLTNVMAYEAQEFGELDMRYLEKTIELLTLMKKDLTK